MEFCWAAIVLLLLAIQMLPYECFQFSMDEYLPLTKSLGISLKKNPDDGSKFNLLNQGYLEQYLDIVKSSLDVQGARFHKLEETNSKTEGHQRRRHVSSAMSAADRRRARSEANRREKLNAQGLRSHVVHSKKKTLEMDEYFS